MPSPSSRSNARFDGAAALRIVEQVVEGAPKPIALHEPLFRGREWDYVKETLDTGWVSSAGAFVDRFENSLQEVCEAPHAVAVVNGTAALHVCLLLAGVRDGDEVLVPSLTFIATVNAVAYCGAVPHFCDSDEATLGIDPEKLGRHLSECAELVQGFCRNRQTGRRILALMPMHTFGHPVDLDALADLCRRWNLVLIEDAAEALGSRYKGHPVGRHGLLTALSFNGNKIVTTGGGGAVLTQDAKLAEAAKHLTTTAKLPHRWAFEHDAIGFNYRLPNLNAALGLAQLEQLPRFLTAKRRLGERYIRAFADFPGARLFHDAPFAESNYWLVALVLDRDEAGQRDEFLELTNNAGILTRPAWRNMHCLPMYEHCPRMDLSTSEELERRIVNLPSSAVLGIDDVS